MDSPLPATTSGHRVSLGDRLRATRLVARLLFVSLKIGPSSFRGLSAGQPDLADILHAVVRAFSTQVSDASHRTTKAALVMNGIAFNWR